MIAAIVESRLLVTSGYLRHGSKLLMVVTIHENLTLMRKFLSPIVFLYTCQNFMGKGNFKHDCQAAAFAAETVYGFYSRISGVAASSVLV